jgi:hypothetical protein
VDRRRLLIALLGVAAVAPASLLFWGFMVDDALISARYAAHLAAGEGYRFNAGGPITDGVTPLGWAHLLAPFAGDGVLAAYRAAKVIGVASWWLAGAVVALAIDRLEGGRAKWLGLALLGTSAPLGAWSAAGMETGLVMALAALAVSARVFGRELACAALAAWVAAWRPEALPWALTLALAPPRRQGQAGPGRSRWLKLAVVAAPAAGVALLRLSLFGHAAPLGAIAKPSTLMHGARYALACAILCGVIALAGRGPRWVLGLQAAVVAHFAAMAIAGGDWMPVSRLAVTALPTLAIAAAALAARGRVLSNALRAGLAVGGQLFVVFTQGAALAGVEDKRLAVIREHAPALAATKVVAALDVGWVGAACDATVVDLAGVTDPEIAVLPGGHTSKRLPSWLLDARGVERVLLRLAPGTSSRPPWAFATTVELWVATTPGFEQSFEPLGVGASEPRYLLFGRRAVPLPSEAPASESGF